MRRLFGIAVVLILGLPSAGLTDATSTEQVPPVLQKSPPAPDKSTPQPPQPPPSLQSPTIELEFAYGTEKQKWVEAVTARFNAANVRIPSGERVVVKPYGAGSGEMIDDLLTERHKPHLISPAAGAFIDIGNAESREMNKGDLVGDTQDLVLSPIVVMMWRETAEKLPRPIKWRDIFDGARDPARWKQLAGPQAAPLKLAHTQPDQSNSGLHAIFLEAFAAANKFDKLDVVDLNTPEVKKYFSDVEKAVPYYMNSTGNLARDMVEKGPTALTAAIVYENSVIEANRPSAKSGAPPKVVAIYPEEGTFPSEHPVGIVERPWVTEKHKQAAQAYINFLRDTPQQEEAKKFGFRPYDTTKVPLGDLLSPELGVSAMQPTFLEPPPYAAINIIRQLWRDNKNPSATPVPGR